jgi:hypothetical protein
MRLFITAFACLLLYSCESTHTSRKIIQNESSHTVQIEYFSGYYGMDSIYTLPTNASVDIELTQKLGNHPCELPSSPCSITEDDSLVVSLENYMFTGDFRDEYNWIEDLGGNKHTIQVCTYVITDDDFE